MLTATKGRTRRRGEPLDPVSADFGRRRIRSIASAAAHASSAERRPRNRSASRWIEPRSSSTISSRTTSEAPVSALSSCAAESTGWSTTVATCPIEAPCARLKRRRAPIREARQIGCARVGSWVANSSVVNLDIIQMRGLVSALKVQAGGRIGNMRVAPVCRSNGEWVAVPGGHVGRTNGRARDVAADGPIASRE